jgi:hypothetical protein
MRRSIVATLAFTSLAIGPTLVRAGPFSVGPLVVVTGADPFATCTADDPSGQPGTVFPGSVVEPWVEVNPTNPLNIVAGWQQDRWSNGGSRGLVAGVSMDGGLSFTQVVIPKVNLCSGGTVANGGDLHRSTDPWLTFAPNGDLYFFTLSLDITAPPKTPGGNGKNALFVNKSTDGGLSWDDPIQIIEDANPRFLNDKNSITADPFDSRYVYATWDRLKLPVGSIINPEHVFGFGFKGPAMLSRTTNGGATWEPARVIFDPGANNQTIGNQIVVLPDGTLVDVFDLILNFKNPGGQIYSVFNVALIRSTDRGETWTKGPAILAAQLLTKATFDPQGSGVRDPDTGALVRTGDIIPEVAVDRNPGNPFGHGNLYPVWQDSRFSNAGDFSELTKLADEVAFSRSTDGGFTWSAPIKINKTPTNIPVGNRQAFTPAIRVAADGTVGVTYYDFRNNTPAPGLPTDAFIVHCHPSATVSCTSPADWEETQLTPASFNMENAPVARGFFTGDYEGLAVVGNQFRPVFVEAGASPGTSFAVTTRAGP